MRISVGLLLLCSSLALARDPFQPLTEELCLPRAAEPDGWRLQGIVGTSQRYVAWLVSPQGKSHRLTTQATLPHTAWQVTELTARSLTLRAVQRCPPQQITWVIKGGFYEMDGPDIMADPERATAGP